MERCLIVANQTLGGGQLVDAVRERVGRGEREFSVIVPATLPEHEAGWSGGFRLPDDASSPLAVAEMEEVARRRESLIADAERRATDRLEQMVATIRSLGGEADGSVGDADPVTAVKRMLADQSFSEVIVSTLPAGISRWLKMDLPSRVARMTKAPVTTIEAQD